MFSNLRDFGVVPFVKAETEEDALLTAQALVAGGLPIMELIKISLSGRLIPARVLHFPPVRNRK